jgi:hypothetical protein
LQLVEVLVVEAVVGVEAPLAVVVVHVVVVVVVVVVEVVRTDVLSGNVVLVARRTSLHLCISGTFAVIFTSLSHAESIESPLFCP